MFKRMTQPAPLPQYRHVPVPPSFWDDPAFGSHEPMESSTGSWVPDRHGEAGESDALWLAAFGFFLLCVAGPARLLGVA